MKPNRSITKSDLGIRDHTQWKEEGWRSGPHLLQGLQYCLTVHLQHMQPGLVLDPAVGHHRHQVEADVVVGLPAVTAAAVRAAPALAPPSS